MAMKLFLEAYLRKQFPYFETLMYRFMEEQGYSKQEIAKVQFRRTQDYAKSVAQSIDGLMILRDYLIFGKISDTHF